MTLALLHKLSVKEAVAFCAGRQILNTRYIRRTGFGELGISGTFQECGYLLRVLFGKNGTGCVNERTARFQQWPDGIQNLRLEFRQLRNITVAA